MGEPAVTGVEGFSAAEPDIATTLATKIMALDWPDRRKWTCESQADRHGELQEMIDAALSPILAEKEREKAAALGLVQGHAVVIAKLEARALAAEAALAGERERIAANLQAQADALWERCETKRSDPPSNDEQADAAQAFALQKAAAAIRAQGE